MNSLFVIVVICGGQVKLIAFEVGAEGLEIEANSSPINALYRYIHVYTAIIYT